MGDLTDEQQWLAFRFAAVALPLDATGCDPWEWHSPEDWRRYFLTREWDVDGLCVSVGGEQNHLGKTSRWLHVGGDDHSDSSDRHELVDALKEAGRLLEELVYRDGE
jgi:hypothetical protein